MPYLAKNPLPTRKWWFLWFSFPVSCLNIF